MNRVRLVELDELDRLAGAADLAARPPGDLLRRLVATIYASRADTRRVAPHSWSAPVDAILPARGHRRMPVTAGDVRPVRVGLRRVQVRRHHSGGRTGRLVGTP